MSKLPRFLSRSIHFKKGKDGILTKFTCFCPNLEIIFNFFQNKSGYNKDTKNTSLAAPGALAHRLQRRTVCNVLRPTYTHQIKKRRSLLYSNFGVLINFRKISFSIQATFRLPSSFGGRKTGLGTPKLENQDHFSILIWALQTTFAK